MTFIEALVYVGFVERLLEKRRKIENGSVIHVVQKSLFCVLLPSIGHALPRRSVEILSYQHGIERVYLANPGEYSKMMVTSQSHERESSRAFSTIASCSSRLFTA